MAAMYRVSFQDGQSLIVHSADSKGSKKRDLRCAYSKAITKAKDKRKRLGLKPSLVVSCNCVG